MTFGEASVFALIVFGGVSTLIAAIVAGSVGVSFLLHAEPMIEEEGPQ